MKTRRLDHAAHARVAPLPRPFPYLRLRLATAALLLGLAGAQLLAGCASHSAESATRPTPVAVERAWTGPGAPAIRTEGIVANKDEMRLSFKVTGIIERLRVQEGQSVARGALLASIEPTEINAQVEQARALAEKAERDLARAERLYANGVYSLGQLQDLRTQLTTARAQLESARFNQGHAVIIAPRDGVVLRKLAEERELISAGQPVVLLGARDQGYVVRAGLADRDVVQLRLGDTAAVHLDAYPDRVLTASVSEIAGAADERSGLFQIEVRMAGERVPLASGLVAKLELHPSSARERTLTYIPIAAIVEGDGASASVFVLQEGHARRRAVHVAFIDGERVALRDGLAPGESVITDGALYLRDGEAVEIPRLAAATGIVAPE